MNFLAMFPSYLTCPKVNLIRLCKFAIVMGPINKELRKCPYMCTQLKVTQYFDANDHYVIWKCVVLYYPQS